MTRGRWSMQEKPRLVTNVTMEITRGRNWTAIPTGTEQSMQRVIPSIKLPHSTNVKSMGILNRGIWREWGPLLRNGPEPRMILPLQKIHGTPVLILHWRMDRETALSPMKIINALPVMWERPPGRKKRDIV